MGWGRKDRGCSQSGEASLGLVPERAAALGSRTAGTFRTRMCPQKPRPILASTGVLGQAKAVCG